jgi:hypothetical protein
MRSILLLIGLPLRLPATITGTDKTNNSAAIIKFDQFFMASSPDAPTHLFVLPWYCKRWLLLGLVVPSQWDVVTAIPSDRGDCSHNDCIVVITSITIDTFVLRSLTLTIAIILLFLVASASCAALFKGAMTINDVSLSFLLLSRLSNNNDDKFATFPNSFLHESYLCHSVLTDIGVLSLVSHGGVCHSSPAIPSTTIVSLLLIFLCIPQG